jgi:hypothetical protein
MQVVLFRQWAAQVSKEGGFTFGCKVGNSANSIYLIDQPETNLEEFTPNPAGIYVIIQISPRFWTFRFARWMMRQLEVRHIPRFPLHVFALHVWFPSGGYHKGVSFRRRYCSFYTTRERGEGKDSQGYGRTERYPFAPSRSTASALHVPAFCRCQSCNQLAHNTMATCHRLLFFIFRECAGARPSAELCPLLCLVPVSSTLQHAIHHLTLTWSTGGIGPLINLQALPWSHIVLLAGRGVLY